MATARADALRDHVFELLEPLGDVRIRAMFGGHGVYQGDAMFALIAEGTLYLKVDARNAPRFEAAGLEAFVYPSPKGPMKMGYRRAPDDGMDDGEVLREWARGAIDAALAARKPAAKKKATAVKKTPVAKKRAVEKAKTGPRRAR